MSGAAGATRFTKPLPLGTVSGPPHFGHGRLLPAIDSGAAIFWPHWLQKNTMS